MASERGIVGGGRTRKIYKREKPKKMSFEGNNKNVI